MSLIEIERRGAIALLTLNRPERLNALPDPEDGEAFAVACETLNADSSIRCAVMTGAGRACSAGGALKAMRDRTGLVAGSGGEIRERAINARAEAASEARAGSSEIAAETAACTA